MTVIGEYDSKAFAEDFPLDFGEGSRGSFILKSGNGTVGVLEAHITPNGDLCCGALYWESPHDRYEGVIYNNESYDKITLTPEVMCECGHHGYMRNSRWHPFEDSTC